MSDNSLIKNKLYIKSLNKLIQTEISDYLDEYSLYKSNFNQGIYKISNSEPEIENIHVQHNKKMYFDNEYAISYVGNNTLLSLAKMCLIKKMKDIDLRFASSNQKHVEDNVNYNSFIYLHNSKDFFDIDIKFNGEKPFWSKYFPIDESGNSIVFDLNISEKDFKNHIFLNLHLADTVNNIFKNIIGDGELIYEKINKGDNSVIKSDYLPTYLITDKFDSAIDKCYKLIENPTHFNLNNNLTKDSFLSQMEKEVVHQLLFLLHQEKEKHEEYLLNKDNENYVDNRLSIKEMRNNLVFTIIENEYNIQNKLQLDNSLKLLLEKDKPDGYDFSIILSKGVKVTNNEDFVKVSLNSNEVETSKVIDKLIDYESKHNKGKKSLKI